MHYKEDFYNEPSEFEQMVDDLKARLLKSVKEEYINEMDALREENAELQDFKKRKDEIEAELRETCWKIAYAESKFKDARLEELLGENLCIGWGVESELIEAPKCDKCDKERRIHFKSPSGEDLTEPCSCNKGSYYKYKPVENELIAFHMNYKNNSYRIKHPERCFTKTRDYDDCCEYSICRNIYDGQPFEDVNRHGVIFLKKDDCVKYCKWITAKNKAEAGIAHE